MLLYSRELCVVRMLYLCMLWCTFNRTPPEVQEKEDNPPESEGDDPDNQEPNVDQEVEEGAVTDEGQEVEEAKEEEDEPGMWDEMFKTHKDSKPYGTGSCFNRYLIII